MEKGLIIFLVFCAISFFGALHLAHMTTFEFFDSLVKLLAFIFSLIA